jgi:catechol-2,3-dioxygenase
MTRVLDTSQTIAPSEFAHIVLNTARFDAVKAWYGDVLGMEVVVESGPLCFMSYDGEHHRLAILNTPELEDRQQSQAGVNHFAYTLPDLAALLATYKRLKDKDIEPWWCINHGPTTSMYYRDPDGNGVELQVDNFSKEEAKAWMVSPIFQENPLGIDFDPDRLVARFEAGDPLEELLKQGSAPKDD